MIRTSALQSIDLGSTLVSSHTNTVEKTFPASLLDAQHERDSARKKPASALVMSLGKALKKIPASC